MKQFSHLLASTLIIWTLQVCPLLSNAQGAALHTLNVADGITFPCDNTIHSASTSYPIPAGAKIVSSYMFVTSNGEWAEGWFSTNYNIVSEVHAMRDPVPVNNGNPAFGWWTRAEHFEFAPNWYVATVPNSVSGWCNKDGQEMQIYATIRYTQ